MKSEKTNRSRGRTIAALLFSAYQEYCHNYYPRDPGIYVIRAHPATVLDLIDYFEGVSHIKSSNAIATEPECRIWGMRVEKDLRLKKGTIIFGPETIEIEWDGK